ncbi:NAD(P)/FAD-dependent oxidoreductase [Dickeya solani]|uniref:NAD(P)/FAD-dependent oxidoreductase n=1 Tax=Dickeya solani TaxID=1089444 RepID=A0AAX4EYZ8_9GAMM|nr:NAD(P)/FAD-dependent oxidoreductase [Dickeya solani]WOA52645.1 NAD(P)/FAD-dependent oxidoreductase [Dickeya solani]
MNDVIIIGGSFAGLAAALQLGRARRKVTVLDTGLPRNRFADRSHGVLGHDHKLPQDILTEARLQLTRYPTIKLVSARAESVSGAIDDFSVLTSDGESLRARRLILSYGVADQIPAVPGFAEGWGSSTCLVPIATALKSPAGIGASSGPAQCRTTTSGCTTTGPTR